MIFHFITVRFHSRREQYINAKDYLSLLVLMEMTLFTNYKSDSTNTGRGDVCSSISLLILIAMALASVFSSDHNIALRHIRYPFTNLRNRQGSIISKRIKLIMYPFVMRAQVMYYSGKYLINKSASTALKLNK